jgi:cytochrome c-type biogenesis protein CcmF
MMLVSYSIIVWRRDDLQPESEIESPLSREAAFLMNNWVLLGATFAVLLGTVYPSIAEAVIGTTVTVGKPYFNAVMIPVGLILLALAGIGPLLSWRKMSPQKFFSVLKWPLAFGILTAPAFYLLSRWHTGAAAAVCIGVFVAAAIFGEFARGAKARRNMTGENYGESFFNLILRNRQRYGGYFVHLGIVLMFAGFAGAAFDTVTEPIKMKPGETMKIGEYTLRFNQMVQPKNLSPEKEREVLAEISVLHNGKEVNLLRPGISFFKNTTMAPAPRPGQPAPEPQTGAIPAIASNPAHDLYLVLAEYDVRGPSVSIKAWLNPLVMWIWVSTIFFIGGSVLSLLPEPRAVRVRAREAARVENQENAR